MTWLLQKTTLINTAFISQSQIVEKKSNSTSVATTSHIETVGYSPWQVASLFVDAFALFYGLPHSDDILPQWNWKIVTRPPFRTTSKAETQTGTDVAEMSRSVTVCNISSFSSKSNRP